MYFNFRTVSIFLNTCRGFTSALYEALGRYQGNQTFRTIDYSYHRRFVPQMDFSYRGRFVPWIFRTIIGFFVPFVPRTFRTIIGRFVPSQEFYVFPLSGCVRTKLFKAYCNSMAANYGPQIMRALKNLTSHGERQLDAF